MLRRAMKMSVLARPTHQLVSQSNIDPFASLSIQKEGESWIAKVKGADNRASKNTLLKPPKEMGTLSAGHIFHNASHVGTPGQILKAYKDLRLVPDELKRTESLHLIKLLDLVAENRLDYVSALGCAELGLKIRQDLMDVNYPLSIPLEIAVLKCFERLPREFSHILFEHLNSLKGVFSNPQFTNTLWTLLATLGLNGSLDEFYKVNGFTIPSLALLKSHTVQAHFGSAESLYASLPIEISKREEPNFAMMEMYAQVGDPVATKKYLLKLKPKSPRGHALLIKAHAERGQSGDAERVYTKMRRENIPVTDEALVSLIKVFGRAMDLSKANKFFYKKEKNEGYVPSMEMYAALVDAYVFNGEPLAGWRLASKAIKDFQDRVQSSVNAPLPLSLMKPLGLDLKDKETEVCVERFKAAGLFGSTKSLVLSHLMKCANSAHLQDPSFALELYGMFEGEPRLLGHVEALKAHVGLGQMEQAQGLYDTLADRFEESRVECMIALIKGYASSKNIDKISKIMDEFKTLGISPTLSVFESMLSVVPDFDVSAVKPFMAPSALLHPLIISALESKNLHVSPLV